MATLRQMIDGSKEAFDATVALHNERLNPRQKVAISGASKSENNGTYPVRVSQEQRVMQQEMNRYVYEVAAMGERMQAAYQRGYQDGYRDGSQVNAAKGTPRLNRVPAVLQHNREVDLEE